MATAQAPQALERCHPGGMGADQTVGLLMGPTVMLACFAAIDLRSKAPIPPMRIFCLRTLTGIDAVTAARLGETNQTWDPKGVPEPCRR